MMFNAAGLTLVHEKVQEGLHPGLYVVKMYVFISISSYKCTGAYQTFHRYALR
jgi:hypothetical protein